MIMAYQRMSGLDCRIPGPLIYIPLNNNSIHCYIFRSILTKVGYSAIAPMSARLSLYPKSSAREKR